MGTFKHWSVQTSAPMFECQSADVGCHGKSFSGCRGANELVRFSDPQKFILDHPLVIFLCRVCTRNAIIIFKCYLLPHFPANIIIFVKERRWLLTTHTHTRARKPTRTYTHTHTHTNHRPLERSMHKHTRTFFLQLKADIL